jgi:hypothetical protein
VSDISGTSGGLVYVRAAFQQNSTAGSPLHAVSPWTSDKYRASALLSLPLSFSRDLFAFSDNIMSRGIVAEMNNLSCVIYMNFTKFIVITMS